MNKIGVVLLVCLILVDCWVYKEGLNRSKKASDNLVKWAFGSYVFPNFNASLTFQVEVVSPVEPGTYPVIFFMSGLDGILPEVFYDQFISDLAIETNSIIISLQKLRPIHLPNKEENLFEICLNWTISNVKNIFNADETPSIIRNKVFPDTSSKGYTLMSHSSAGHPVVFYLYKHCGQINKLILMVTYLNNT